MSEDNGHARQADWGVELDFLAGGSAATVPPVSH
jgi:hypothetical protein